MLQIARYIKFLISLHIRKKVNLVLDMNFLLVFLENYWLVYFFSRCSIIQTDCPPADWECSHKPSTYSYNFFTFVSNLYIPDSKASTTTKMNPYSFKDKEIQFLLLAVRKAYLLHNKTIITITY